MARVGSGDGWDIGTWAEGDNPGAGDQDFTNFNDTGLNGQFKRLWRGVKTCLNPDGSMMAAIVDYGNLKTTVADATTIELGGSPAKLRVKDASISTAKLIDDCVTQLKIAADVAGAGLGQEAGGALKVVADEATLTVTGDQVKVKDGGVGTTQLAANSVTGAKIGTGVAGPGLIYDAGSGLNVVPDDTTLYLDGTQKVAIKSSGVLWNHLKATGIGAVVDGTTLEFGFGAGMQVKNDGITAAKISHDNKRTQQMFTCAWATVTDGVYAKSNGEVMTSSVGVPMPQAGSVIAISLCNGNGVVDTWAWTYGTYTFAQGSKISFNVNNVASIWNIYAKKNGANFISGGEMEMTGSPSAPMFLSCCVEFDD